MVNRPREIGRVKNGAGLLGAGAAALAIQVVMAGLDEHKLSFRYLPSI